MGCKGRVKRTVWMKRSDQGRVEIGDPRTKEQIKPRRVLESEKPDPYHPSLPHVVTINGTV